MIQRIASGRDYAIGDHDTISKLPASEELLLLRELAHRVNNEFASAIAAISLASTRSTHHEVKVTLGQVLNRLENYALVQRALQVPMHSILVDATAHIRLLCRSISSSKLESKGIELVLLEQPLKLRSEQCWRLGMIVSELITNSACHAFSEGRGAIEVNISTWNNFARCRVTDDGAAVKNVRPTGGLCIVEGLVKGLRGRIRQYFTSQGTTSVVTFPLHPDLTTPIAVQISKSRPFATKAPQKI